jgi:predicted 3-demethylubiquinone-9 3-methyltransferase (glyoxalase superfamily)
MFSEAISLQVYCDTQEELDYYLENFSEGEDNAVE